MACKLINLHTIFFDKFIPSFMHNNNILWYIIFIRYELLVHKWKEGYFMLFTQNKQNGGDFYY